MWAFYKEERFLLSREEIPPLYLSIEERDSFSLQKGAPLYSYYIEESFLSYSVYREERFRFSRGEERREILAR